MNYFVFRFTTVSVDKFGKSTTVTYLVAPNKATAEKLAQRHTLSNESYTLDRLGILRDWEIECHLKN